jgi:hypothetical protein
MTIIDAIDKMLADQERRNAWLLKAGLVARRLNEQALNESTRSSEGGNTPLMNHGD